MSIHSQDVEQTPNSDINKYRNSVANLRKVACNKPNVDLFNDIVYTKFGHILSQSISRFAEFQTRPKSFIKLPHRSEG